jgi:hypothetical protein
MACREGKTERVKADGANVVELRAGPRGRPGLDAGPAMAYTSSVGQDLEN